MRFSMGISALVGALAATLLHVRPAAAQTELTVVLLDRSGSMANNGQCRSGDVDRKWVCAIESAADWVSMNDLSNQGTYFVWQLTTLADDQIVIRDNGPGNLGFTRDAAISTINGLEGPLVDDSRTPLAGAFCEAVKFLRKFADDNLIFDASLKIRLESDGLENETPALHDCKGEDSGEGTDFVWSGPTTRVWNPATGVPTHVDGLLIGSWQSRMYDYALTGAVHPYPPDAAFSKLAAFFVPAGSQPVLANASVDFIEEFFEPEALALSARSAGEGVDSGSSQPLARPMAALAAPPPSTTEDFVDFLSGFAEAFNGRFTRFGSGALPPAGDPFAFHEQTADVNDDGCVNAADYTFVQQLYGQKVSAATPNTYRADINLDGVVSSEDYLLMTAHYGQGCSTPPGTIPTLGAALLGFDTLSNWSSPQGALSLNSVQHTEGTFSLRVGGTGWRDVSSASFSSSQFGTVRPKLAVDVYVPKNPVNKFWYGQVQAFINIPSAGISNLYVGAYELTGKPTGAFSTATFNLPQNVRTALGQNRNVTLRFAINSNDTGHFLDKIRLAN